jgi:hypothetical protein
MESMRDGLNRLHLAGVDVMLDSGSTAHLIEINALTLDGLEGPQLTANFSFASRLLSEAQVRALAEEVFRDSEGWGDVSGWDGGWRRRAGWSRCEGRVEFPMPRDEVARALDVARARSAEHDRLHVTAEWQSRIIARLADLHGPPVRTAMRWRLRRENE